MLNQETKSALKEMRDNLAEEAKAESRSKGQSYGRKLDQIELSYKQHVPPQILSRQNGS